MDSFLDYLKQEVRVGDPVITTQLGYRNFIRATVIRITPKMVILRGPKRWGMTGEEEWKADHAFVIKDFTKAQKVVD